MFYFMTVVLLLAAFVLIWWLDAVPNHCTCDASSPLNFMLFQQPKGRYSDQLVNHWIDKGWRSDGERIPARLEVGYSEDVEVADRDLIIYSHGNAENLMYCTEFARELTRDLSKDMIIYDYSGYGLSSADKWERSADGVNATLKQVIQYATETLGYSRENLILAGYSLGSGPSTYVASQMSMDDQPPKALILIGAYSSIKEVVADSTHDLVADMFEERWNSSQNLRHVSCPILLLHGQRDRLISISHAYRMKSANPSAKLVILSNAGHVTMDWRDSIYEIRKWLGENA